MLCAKCSQNDDTACQSCGQMMPPGRGKVCEACAWRQSLAKRIDIDKAAFTQAPIAEHFESFGRWLEHRAGAHQAALTINRYFDFFLEIDKVWGRLPGYEDLLEHFGAEGLRRVRNPMRWLNEAHGVQPDEKLKLMNSERARIRAILGSIPSDRRAGQVLHAYCEHLDGFSQEHLSALRSTRMALRPAADLLLQASPETLDQLPKQHDLDRYLRRTPGQRAAITGFVNYLAQQHGCELALRHRNARSRNRRRETLAKALMRLAKSATTTEQSRLRWIQIGLEYFHRVKVARTQLLTATIKPAGDRVDEWEVTLADQVYVLPRGPFASEEG